MRNAKKHRDIKLITTEKKKLFGDIILIYHTTKFFTKNLLNIETRKISDTNRYVCLFCFINIRSE